METYRFLEDDGTFLLENPQHYSGLYFPVAGEAGLKSAVTPELGGDAKLDQNHFLLEPVSVENLHNNRGTRNFWCCMGEKGYWSATGISAEALSKRFGGAEDACELEAGFMWQKVTRTSAEYALRAEITSFAPVDVPVEVMRVVIQNEAEEAVAFTPVAAIPIYGRSADNIRDHRHVTSLLHRICTTETGVFVTPTLSFDERGHQKNDMTYFAAGFRGDGTLPESFYPTVEEFIGEGGNFEHPLAVVKNLTGVPKETKCAGKEAMGGIRFAEVTLGPGETEEFTIVLGAVQNGTDVAAILERFQTADKTEKEFESAKAYWQEKVNVSFQTGDETFDRFLHWVSFQPILRRIYGCSFLPHHDYGKGGRGWRDLWQDCLALLMMDPSGVREMLLANFGGVRMDGSNATIIGNNDGNGAEVSFLADRNNITRVWMDHGVWPQMTTFLYLNQTGDLTLLEQEVPYFKDKQIARGTAIDSAWNDDYGCKQKTTDGAIYQGTVLEHLLLQNLSSFYDVGEHNHIRLRGADWNDALDMAKERGESVAFTNAYAGNLKELSRVLLEYEKRTGKHEVRLAEELDILLVEQEGLYDSIEQKHRLLAQYFKTCVHDVSGRKKQYSVSKLAANLARKADWMMEHIRNTEWVTDANGHGWFNGYYDNSGRQVEGEHENGVRMMLTGEVFSVMAGTATEEQTAEIIKSADCYLYDESCGGYRLNTDFGEVKADLGRMFGFAYGEKENGAVFSHMAVMYANALYKRGFAKEGYKALHALYAQAVNFEKSRIYPGIPEYFGAGGRGLYHYLTGAASWYLLTVITEMFGVKGYFGNLVLVPKLVPGQFDKEGRAKLTLFFAGKKLRVTYEKKEPLGANYSRISEVKLDGTVLQQASRKKAEIDRSVIEALSDGEVHEISVMLE